MPTLTERLDAACEGRELRTIPAATMALLDRERTAIEAGDRVFVPLSALVQEFEAEELATGRHTSEARPRASRLPSQR
jgi:hypothetical protein